jgi:hypothetical protein
MVSPIHAEDTFDASILEEIRASETAKKEADIENESSEQGKGGGVTDGSTGSGITTIDGLEKNEVSEGDFNSPNSSTPLVPSANYNAETDETTADGSEEVAGNETETSEQTSNSATNDSEQSNVTGNDTTNSSNTAVNNSSNSNSSSSSATSTSENASNPSGHSETTTIVGDTNNPTNTSDGSTNSTTNNPSSTTNNANNTSVNVIPSQPIMPVNQEFADHWIDARPQMAVIIELKKDDNDDDRFFYLYSDITNQAGYEIDTGNGTVSYNGDGTVTYTAKYGFSGTDTFFYGYDGWDYGRGGYGQGSYFNSYGYGWQDYGHWGYGGGWGYDYNASYRNDNNNSRYSSKRKRKAKVRVSKHLGSPIGPTICQIYAVHDEGVADSQFVKFKVIDLKEKRTVSAKIGPEYKGFDIEAIAIHPITAMLYAASQDLLYLVHPSEASLKVIGEIGYDSITGFAFHPKDATLFAATDTEEEGKEKGILQIDPDTGASKIILPSSYPIEALAWNVEGSILYAAEKTKHPDENGVMQKGSNLIAWYYDGTRLLGQGFESEATTRRTRSDNVEQQPLESSPAESELPPTQQEMLPDSQVEFLRLGLNVIGSTETGRDIEINAETGAGGDSPFTICEGFGEIKGEVESLETRADGMLLFSVDQGIGNKIYAFNPQTCTVQESTSFGTPYSDIEAIAWPIHCQSSAVPVPKGWDINFIGQSGSFCIEDGKPFEIKGKVELASKGFLNLKTSWEVVSPETAKCPQISEETGLANLTNLINCPAKALTNSQMLTGDSEFTMTAWWPGLTDTRGNYHDKVEVRFTAELFDMLGTPMQDFAANNKINGGRSIATRSVVATAEVCEPQLLTPAQLLSEFFVNDYAIDPANFDLGSSILTVRIDDVVYSGRITDAMLAAIKQGAPSSSFQDVDNNGLDDLVLIYADGSKQVLFAQGEAAALEEEALQEVEPENATDEADKEEAGKEETDEEPEIEPETIEEEADFSEYVTQFNDYLQQVLSQDEYDFGADGLLSLVLNDIAHLGQLSKQPIDKVETVADTIVLGDITQNAEGLPYFPVTFTDGQVFALYYLGEASDEAAEDSSSEGITEDDVTEEGSNEEVTEETDDSTTESEEVTEDDATEEGSNEEVTEETDDSTESEEFTEDEADDSTESEEFVEDEADDSTESEEFVEDEADDSTESEEFVEDEADDSTESEEFTEDEADDSTESEEVTEDEVDDSATTDDADDESENTEEA